MYYIRLDDASEFWEKENWLRCAAIFKKFNIRPLIGIIPNNKDEQLLKYDKDSTFWNTIHQWQELGWEFALHGYDHVYITQKGGLNPVNKRSEFAGVELETQKQKIADGIKILEGHGIHPKVFFAPSHTFDKNTLQALYQASNIRIISDTIANSSYNKKGFTFVPQQSGKCRELPFKETTFCYHPNIMSENDFVELEEFIAKHCDEFRPFPVCISTRKFNLKDWILKRLYFIKRKLKK